MPSPAAAVRRPTIVHLPEGRDAETFAAAVRRGLGGSPKALPCQFFYDEAGSLLFERITGLPEYYLTRTEDAILAAHAPAMVAGSSAPPTLIEMGSGSSSKTRRLIAAALEAHGALHYIPIDVSAEILEASARALAREFPGLRVSGYAADYRAALSALSLRVEGPRLVAFLGSSLGNYGPDEAAALLAHVARTLGPDDRLLLGTDLAKDRATLEAAYDDPAGVSAAFNRNLLARINRELGGSFDLAAFAHRAEYRVDLGRVDMHLVSLRAQDVAIPGAGLVASFAAGEAIHTESSYKYTEAGLLGLAARSGFAEDAAWVDPAGRFRVQRWRPA